MRATEFRTWARMELGHDADACSIGVELSDSMIDQSLNTAKDWFNSFVGLHKEVELDIAVGQVDYDLAAVTPAIDEVMKLWLPDDVELMTFRGLYPGFLDIDGIPYDSAGRFSNGNPMGTITQTLQYLKSMRTTFSSDVDWEFYREDFEEGNPVRILRLMPAPTKGGKAIFLYRVDPKEVKLRMFAARDLYIIREYALAECKYKLGRIRGKYPDGLPAAGAAVFYLVRGVPAAHAVTTVLM